MSVFEQFPYTNFHELNLDWVLNSIKTMQSEFTSFISQNSIKYADPIQWDITKQYERNTVVVDVTGNGYLSVKAVPGGISIDRTEYWTVIGNFSALWGSVKKGITLEDEGHSTTATKPRVVGDLVWLNDDLIEVTVNMIIGTAYAVGSNCRKYSMQILLTELENAILNEATARSNADTAEALARTNADNELEDEIALEVSTRTNADTAEALARTNADTAEALARTNADTAEALARTNADTAEALARTTADNELEDLINAIPRDSIYVDVKNYGAIGDGISDDTLAIQNACIASALLVSNNQRPTLLFPTAVAYKTTDTITISKNVNVIMDTHIHYKGTGMDRPILVVGQTTEQNRCVYLKLQAISTHHETMFSLENENFIALKVYNAYTSKVWVVRTEGTTIGFQCVNDAGICNSSFDFGLMFNHKITLDMPITIGGWASILSFSGMLAYNTENFDITGKRMIRAISTTKDGWETCTFNNFGIEDQYLTSDPNSTPIYSNCFRSCKFENLHLEASNFKYVASLVFNPVSPYYTKENVFEVGYTANNNLMLNDLTSTGTNTVKRVGVKKSTLMNKTITPGDICYYTYTGGTNYNWVKNWQGTSLGAITKTIGVPGTIDTNGLLNLNSSYECAVQSIDTTYNKEFKLVVVKADSTLHKVLLRCYDASGSIIIDMNNVQIEGGYWNAGYYAFITEYVAEFETQFKVSTTVKKVDVIICGGSSTKIKEISMYTLNSDIPTYYTPNDTNRKTTVTPSWTGTSNEIVYNGGSTVNCVGWFWYNSIWNTFGFTTGVAIPDTTDATLVLLEAEVNKLKSALRMSRVIA